MTRSAVATSLLVFLIFVCGVWFVFVHNRATYSLSHVEIASTPEEQTKGLGGRTVIPDDYGMLFVFPSDHSYGFWMKDMEASIDIIWLSDDMHIIGVLNSVATSTYPSVFFPPAPVRYVLETRAGLATSRGWATSTPLSLPLK